MGVSAYVRLALEACVTPPNALPRDTAGSRSADRGEPATGATVRDEILTMVEAMWRDVPEEDLATLPPDFSAHLDHYLSGTPQRT